MDVIALLKEEQKQYRMYLLEDIQDSSGAAVIATPGSSPAQKTLFPTSYPRHGTKIKLKVLPMKTMEDFLMKLQLLQNMAAQQGAENPLQQ